MIDSTELKHAFRAAYGKEPRLFSAPGRVNLIGEHTDYNDGFVLPMAVDRRTAVAAASRPDRKVQVHAFDLNDNDTFSLDAPELPPSKKWVAYVEGVALELEQRGIKLTGADLAIASNLPIGAGLSSSAALEIAVGKSLLALSNQPLDSVQLALVAQKAEHVYAGTKCGIMDQLTVTLAQKGYALLIDCRSLDVKPIKLNLPDTAVVVCNTNVKHELASSAYNERRAECERAVEILRRSLPHIRALRDVSIIEFERYAGELPDVLRKRARHVVTENQRTLEAAEALEASDLALLGHLMVLSHKSLRVDYEVSCEELDIMVDLALKQDGVYGARMTGGGFGGCTVNLVRQEMVPEFSDSIKKEYFGLTNIKPDIYLVQSDDGVAEH